MTPKEAMALLTDAELVPLFDAAMAYTLEVRDQFLAAGVPAVVGDCPGRT